MGRRAHAWSSVSVRKVHRALWQRFASVKTTPNPSIERTHIGAPPVRSRREASKTVSVPGHERRFGDARDMSASLIGRLGQALSGYPPLQCRFRSRARASLRTRHQGPSIMGFEDQAEQSLPRPCREIRPTQADIRTHLIHRPARDIIPPLGGSQIFLLSDLILYVLALRRPP